MTDAVDLEYIHWLQFERRNLIEQNQLLQKRVSIMIVKGDALELGRRELIDLGEHPKCLTSGGTRSALK